MERFKEIEKRDREFEDEVLEVNRVSRTIKGGRRIGFRVLVCIGNRKGTVGIGVAKAADVMSAVGKAKRKAMKNKIHVPLQNGTIPHELQVSFGAADLFLKPAGPGTGIIAGGIVRSMAGLAGIENLLSKILGTKNKISNAKAMIKALESFKT